jgi:DNA polymerase elongation subunit (family B)
MKAIEVIHANEEWGGEVVYGDTDSLFVHLPGKTKAEAFDIGEDIAKTITNQNPRPIKLKFEKVPYTVYQRSHIGLLSVRATGEETVCGFQI